MRTVCGLLVVAACSGTPDQPTVAPLKSPNTELVLGDFERRPPAGTQAIRFAAGGKFWLAKNKGELEHTPHLADGTYKLDGDELTLTAEQGMCAENAGEREATYKVVISSVGIRFAKVNDGCEDRARMDGQTWWRIKHR